MTKEDKEKLKDYKAELIKVLEKSQEGFEKQLSYISAGALGLSMIFIEKVVKNINHANFKWLLAGSWFLLGLTLTANLISHLISARNMYKTLEDIENDKYEPEKVRRRTNNINKLNYATVVSLLFGILFLILFVTINLYSMSIKTNDVDQPKPQTGQVPPPPPVMSPSKPAIPPKK
jgi:quinol-cytochrome oxidoreductase complex cytochrome b subunit